MRFSIRIQHVQHIVDMSIDLDMNDNKLTCIVGKNGVGKTTLIKAFRNLSNADTFIRTSGSGIFSAESRICYDVGESHVEFEYDAALGTINFRGSISREIKSLLEVELPMPYGDRFHFYQSVSDADSEIRRQIILEQYSRPDELIEFLSDIYSSDKFQNLVECRAKGRSYYSILLADNKYVREDYLSSGEYFLVSLYRSIRSQARLIVVDEIDLSLDAAAQVHLLRKLRVFCKNYGCNVLFTTHSLAMMRTLAEDELFYMDRQDNMVVLYAASYSYIKTLLFGFLGWDRYILTEDAVLKSLLEELIRRHCPQLFYQYKIIFVGGGSQVSGLLKRNEKEGFLSGEDNVIAVLDGDQKSEAHAQHKNIYFIPFLNVEQELMDCYKDPEFSYNIPDSLYSTDKKKFYRAVLRSRVVSEAQVISYLCDKYESEMASLISVLNGFLAKRA